MIYLLLCLAKMPLAVERACKPNPVSAQCAGGVHSSRPFVAERLKRPTRKRRSVFRQNRKQAASISFPYLALHREEFAWPNMLPRSPVSSYLTVSPITFEKAGLFSVALVVNFEIRKSHI